MGGASRFKKEANVEVEKKKQQKKKTCILLFDQQGQQKLFAKRLLIDWLAVNRGRSLNSHCFHELVDLNRPITSQLQLLSRAVK